MLLCRFSPLQSTGQPPDAWRGVSTSVREKRKGKKEGKSGKYAQLGAAAAGAIFSNTVSQRILQMSLVCFPITIYLSP